MSEETDIEQGKNEGGFAAPVGSPGMSTDIVTLRAANWEKLEWDVHERITALHAIVLRLEPDALNDKIARELVAPALALLAEFCTRVELEPEESTDEDHDVLNRARIDQSLGATSENYAETLQQVAEVLGMPFAPGRSIVARVRELVSSENTELSGGLPSAPTTSSTS